jgi:hypothetical protein
MKRIKRVVTVTFEYDSVDEALRHRSIMETDGWAVSGFAVSSPRSAEYTLELTEEDAL